MGGDESMSPEQREVFRLLKGRLGVARNVQGQIDAAKQNFTTQANEASASMEASSARRGMPMNLGQRSLAQADIQGSYGKALATAIPQIQHNAKDEELGILQSLAGMAPGPDKGGAPGLSGLLANLMLLLKKKKMPGIGEEGPLGDYNIGEGSPLGDYNTEKEVYG